MGAQQAPELRDLLEKGPRREQEPFPELREVILQIPVRQNQPGRETAEEIRPEAETAHDARPRRKEDARPARLDRLVILEHHVLAFHATPQNPLGGFDIGGRGEGIPVGAHERPDAVCCAGPDPKIHALLLVVAQEGAPPARIECIGQEQQKAHVELKMCREERHELMHRVQPLQEDGAALGAVVDTLVGVNSMSRPQAERMAEAAPVLLDQHGKAVQGAIVRIEKQLCDAAHLRRPVPSVAAVHQHGLPLEVHHLRNRVCGIKDQSDVVQPPRLVEHVGEVVLVRISDASALHFRADPREAVAHGMDVADVVELQIAARVVGVKLVAISRRTIGERRCLRSAVHDMQDWSDFHPREGPDDGHDRTASTSFIEAGHTGRGLSRGAQSPPGVAVGPGNRSRRRAPSGSRTRSRSRSRSRSRRTPFSHVLPLRSCRLPRKCSRDDCVAKRGKRSLVLGACIARSHFGLTTPPDGAGIPSAAPGQGWDPPLAAEARDGPQLVVADGRGHDQRRRIARAELIVAIRDGDPPRTRHVPVPGIQHPLPRPLHGVVQRVHVADVDAIVGHEGHLVLEGEERHGFELREGQLVQILHKHVSLGVVRNLQADRVDGLADDLHLLVACPVGPSQDLQSVDRTKGYREGLRRELHLRDVLHPLRIFRIRHEDDLIPGDHNLSQHGVSSAPC
mmetsp:Transcript_1233/g.5227  ORF Transcript_1233/g.5227 Transcript_1233/m.5227 type:complete len:680 (+) Transcript_1233:1017-3056(+)